MDNYIHTNIDKYSQRHKNAHIRYFNTLNCLCPLLTSRILLTITFGFPKAWMLVQYKPKVDQPHLAKKRANLVTLTFCSNICRFLTAHLSKEGRRKRYSRLFFSFLTKSSNARKCPTHRKQGEANTRNLQRSSNMLSQFGIWFGYLDVYLSIEYVWVNSQSMI